jgi:hypothetical protein
LHRQRPPANGWAVELERFKFGRIFDASSGVVDILGGIQNVATLIKSAEVCSNPKLGRLPTLRIVPLVWIALPHTRN